MLLSAYLNTMKDIADGYEIDHPTQGDFLYYLGENDTICISEDNKSTLPGWYNCFNMVNDNGDIVN